MPTRWSGIIGIEGELTGDGRLIEKNALVWEDLPIPLRIVNSDVGYHDGAEVAGVIETIERRDNGEIWASGILDDDHDNEAAKQAAHFIAENIKNGVSMDLDSVAFEVRIARELFDQFNEMIGETEESGSDEPETDSEGRVVVAKVNPDDEIMVTTSARIRAATLVDIPAFSRAKIHLDEDAPTSLIDEHEVTLVAAAKLAPVEISHTFFADPRLDEPTGITVSKSGHIYGHLALWDTCHIAHQDVCTQPPSSPSNYAYFHTGSITTDKGEIPVGRITLDTGHAKTRGITAVEAMAHYDNTGTVAAYVRAGEDAHGIWVSGIVREDLDSALLQKLQGQPLSGDWRSIQGHLELVAALSVPVAGFPIPRAQGMVASGRMEALIASGISTVGKPPRSTRIQPQKGLDIAPDALDALLKLASREQAKDRERRARILRQRVNILATSNERSS